MDVLELVKVLILGIVEGITEWLPVSSTGHMILVNEFIKLNVSEEFWSMFEVVIQLGAILAVVVLYFKKLNPFSLTKTKEEKQATWILWIKVLIATMPAAIIGLLFDDWFDEHFYNYQTVAITLILYGIIFILVEKYNKNKEYSIDSLENMTFKIAVLIGVFQLLALIPGTSRSGATIIGAMLIGCSRYVAAEFTFYLAIPVMFGASLLKLLKFGAVSGNELVILFLGMVSAFVVSIIAIKFLMSYIKKNDFTIFGYYRIILGIIVIGYFMMF